MRRQQLVLGNSKFLDPGHLEIRAERNVARREEQSPLPGAVTPPVNIRMPPSKHAKIGQCRWDSDHAPVVQDAPREQHLEVAVSIFFCDS